MGCLDDVVALVVSRPLGPVNTKQVLTERLQSLGAKIAGRLSKEVTHIIFQRQRFADADEHSAEDSDLRALYDRTAKMEYPVFFVSPLWVESCAAEQRRVLERKFVLIRPPSTLFQYQTTPANGSGQKKPGRRKSALPKPADNYSVDTADVNFSSSQQMQGGIAAGNDMQEAQSPYKGNRKRGNSTMPENTDPNSNVPMISSEEDLASGSTQLAAEMLTSLANRVKAECQIGSGGKGNVRPRSAMTPARKRTKVDKGKKAASAPQARRVTSRLARPSRLKQSTQCQPMDIDSSETLRFAQQKKRTARPGPKKCTIKPEAAASLDPVGAEQDCGDISIPEADGQENVLNERGRHLEEQHALRPLRDIPSRLEAQLPILRTEGSRNLGICADQNRQDIPLPGVKRVDSPWTSSMPPLDSVDLLNGPTPPEVWTQKRAWDPHRSGNQDDLAGQDPKLGQYRALNEFVAPHMQGQRRSERKIGNTPANTHLHGGDSAVARSPRQVVPQQGFIALSSVSTATQDTAKTAIQKLRGIRLCPEGCEHRITHLIVGKERRTLKVLVAIANGAWILDPSWLSASLDAGSWLPEQPFESQVRFRSAASKARRAAQEKQAHLLSGYKVTICISEASRKSSGASNAAVLKKLVIQLGGEVIRRFESIVNLCIVTGDEPKRPANAPSTVKVVKEEWLLQAIERFSLPREADLLLL